MVKVSVLDKVLSGLHDKNIRFNDLIKLLKSFGFSERIKGDHHIFIKSNIEEIINIQPTKDGRSKPYQIKQIRNIFVKYKIHNEID